MTESKNGFPADLELYYWPTANGIKISVLLEELGLAYTTRLINIRDGEQHTPAFTAISPSGRIPAIVDHAPTAVAPVALFESAAILLYLAEKADRFLGTPPQRHTLNQWLFWQAAHVPSALGRLHHLLEKAPQRVDWLLERARADATRVYATLEARLGQHDYLLGSDVSILDFAVFPWIQPARQGFELPHYPLIAQWRERLKDRPALQAAYAKGRAWTPQERSLVIQ